MPHSVTVSTTDFDSVSHSSNLCVASKRIGSKAVIER